jgi:2-polyprenyl-3-methyl-5-hydroxy-6-metoxy-1,4-benzoquinol methylase
MICRHETSEIILVAKNSKFCRCVSCSLVYADKEKNENVKDVYANYYSEKTSGRFGFGVEYIVRAFRFIRACGIFLLQPTGKSILDIGSGRGWTLYYLKKYFGYETAVGTQISENALEFSREKLKLEIYGQDLLDIDFAEKFEVVTLWHVLEHVARPEEYVQKIHELLAGKGALLIEVPNFNSWSRKLTGKHWLALDWQHHLTFFTPETLAALLVKYDFKIRKIRTFSLEYSAFTSAQSLVSFITRSDAYFFKKLQAGRINPKMILHFLLFVILFIPCLLINLCLYFSKSGEVVTIIATKK